MQRTTERKTERGFAVQTAVNIGAVLIIAGAMLGVLLPRAPAAFQADPARLAAVSQAWHNAVYGG